MTLITIVNKNITEIIPIIFEFKDKITKHIIIYDLDVKDKKIAKKLKNNIDKLNETYSLKQSIELLEIDEDSKSDMLMIQNSLKDLALDELYLNATSADVSLVVVLSGFILNTGGKVIAYDKQDNTYNLIDTKGFKNHHIKNSMNVQEYINLLDYQIVGEVSKDEIAKTSKSLEFIFNSFKKMFKIRKLITYNEVAKIKKSYPQDMKHLQNLGVLEGDKVAKDTSHFGYLFEQFVYLQLANLDFDDIKIGAKLLFDSKIDKKTSLDVFNEFDILAIKNNHIYTVECKLGDSADAQSIIYKSDSLLGYFGDDSKNFIVNMQKLPYYKQEPQDYKMFKNMTLFRATTNNIEVYNEYIFDTLTFQRKVSKFFSLKRKSSTVFLLGGGDLEMQTIRKLLDKHHQRFIDAKLSWGAKLSVYSSYLNDKDNFIGIELQEDITLPKNYVCIDHHNEKQDKKSSLEQVAKLLNVELNRYQKLVAINDVGHIKALKKFGASTKEIEQIRKKDRKASGVTQKDEEAAKLAMTNIQTKDDIIIIRALSERFSPISDRFYDKNTLIYTNTKLFYSGRDIKILVEHFSSYIDDNKAYYGGNFGFFGIADGIFGKKKIKLIRDEILDLL